MLNCQNDAIGGKHECQQVPVCLKHSPLTPVSRSERNGLVLMNVSFISALYLL